MWEKCKELQEELVKMRRELHQIPELGGNLPETRAYVEAKLNEMGIPFRLRRPMRSITYPDMKGVCMPADMIHI